MSQVIISGLGKFGCRLESAFHAAEINLKQLKHIFSEDSFSVSKTSLSVTV